MPSPTTDPAAARQVVDALDELAGLIAAGDGDGVGQWAIHQFEWYQANQDHLDPTTALSFLEGLQGLLQAVSDEQDLLASAEAIVALRDDFEALVPGGVPSPEPTGPTRYLPGDKIEITSDGDRWAVISVTRVKVVKKYEGGYFDDVPRRGYVYIQAYLTYEALADGVDYNPYDWQVFVGGTAVDSYAFVSNGPEPTLSSGTLPKGRKAAGWLIYEVPAKGEVLLSYGSGFSDEPPVFEVVLRKA